MLVFALLCPYALSIQTFSPPPEEHEMDTQTRTAPKLELDLVDAALSGTDPDAGADLLAGAQRIARSVARGWARVDAYDLATELVIEVMKRPAGLPGAAWTIAQRIAARLNLAEQMGGQVSVSTMRRGGGIDDVATILGVDRAEDGKLRLPGPLSLDGLRDEDGFDPETPAASPFPERETGLVERLTTAVQAELGWDRPTTEQAVGTLVAAMETTEDGTGEDLPAHRLRARLRRLQHRARYAAEAGLTDLAWTRLLRTVLGDEGEPGLLAIITTTEPGHDDSTTTVADQGVLALWVEVPASDEPASQPVKREQRQAARAFAGLAQYGAHLTALDAHHIAAALHSRTPAAIEVLRDLVAVLDQALTALDAQRAAEGMAA
ncbi:hypothetical protein [Georgenia yuyongxinii]|uniref:Uncharacterized protein n=1 Tax=Georgenia yuyongxinii TaxID=2589797 RepID=A0A552WVU8_9MICO|nr:hypothetical protein [Georgenia yuyongxinii]TRW46423.1 hypothetical protein FJ693_05710 [Georgenia yuyongxinii]